jgi:hypothetical protein
MPWRVPRPGSATSHSGEDPYAPRAQGDAERDQGDGRPRGRSGGLVETHQDPPRQQDRPRYGDDEGEQETAKSEAVMARSKRVRWQQQR